MKRAPFIHFLIILALYVFSVGIRMWNVRDGNFQFWFDVGRDAIVSREIIEKKDIKIQGPTASGTDDSVYHGVLYYYLVGPLYTLFQGDPQLVVQAVIVLSSLAIFPVYGLATSLVNPNVGLLAAVLYAFSYDAFRGASWLSNPVIAVVAIPLFFLFLFRVFWKQETKYFPWLMASLALLHQAVIIFLPWWGIILVLATFVWQNKEYKKNWKISQIVLGLIVYLLGVSSMILAQLRALLVGVFSPEKLSSYALRGVGDLGPLTGTLSLFTHKTVQSLFPVMPVLSLVVFVGILLFLWQQKKEQQSFVFIMLTSPLWLLAWHFRNMNHSFLGLESIYIILFAWVATWLWKQRWQWVSLLLVGFYLVNQLQIMKVENTLMTSIYFVPQGTNYAQMIRAIEHTYKVANGQPFTISSMTNPYGYNTTWAYLYSWYGQKQYGYLPAFVGPDQNGIFGGDLLSQQASPSAIHFAIEEPNQGIPQYLYTDFEMKQVNISGTPSAQLLFGSLKMLQFEN